ncbi:MAG: putative rane protein, partial [Ramlibacter sp.]|nr:putative rane protein [Ramlibacter sp.]
MPLPKPTLDNRRFDQLFGEGRSLLPRLAPAWTDQNYSDPGITLLDLGAWLSEQQIFRLDRTSDEALRAFVRLTGVEARMPQVARTVVCMNHAEPLPVALPERLQVGTA